MSETTVLVTRTGVFLLRVPDPLRAEEGLRLQLVTGVRGLPERNGGRRTTGTVDGDRRGLRLVSTGPGEPGVVRWDTRNPLYRRRPSPEEEFTPMVESIRTGPEGPMVRPFRSGKPSKMGGQDHVILIRKRLQTPCRNPSGPTFVLSTRSEVRYRYRTGTLVEIENTFPEPKEWCFPFHSPEAGHTSSSPSSPNPTSVETEDSPCIRWGPRGPRDTFPQTESSS